MVEERDETEKKRLEKVFEGDLKNRIVETSKYIQPSKNTMDFAFMFIPHEAIYYDLLVNKVGEEENLIQRAASKYKVIIVSPTSFLAYLQTVLQGLRALQIEETAKQFATVQSVQLYLNNVAVDTLAPLLAVRVTAAATVPPSWSHSSTGMQSATITAQLSSASRVEAPRCGSVTTLA